MTRKTLIICKERRRSFPLCPWDPNEDPLDVVFAALEDRARRGEKNT